MLNKGSKFGSRQTLEFHELQVLLFVIRSVSATQGAQEPIHFAMIDTFEGLFQSLQFSIQDEQRR